MQINPVWGKVLIGWFLFSHVMIALFVTCLGLTGSSLLGTFQNLGTFVAAILLLEVFNCVALFLFAISVKQK